MENFPQVAGAARDIAAKAAGFGNGKTYEQAKRACEECEWKCDGNFQAAHASMRIAGRLHGRCKAFQVAHAPVSKRNGAFQVANASARNEINQSSDEIASHARDCKSASKMEVCVESD